MKISKKILVSIVITMLLFNVFSDDYKRGQDTAYAAFVFDDIAIGTSALIILSGAAVAEYFRTNPAQFEVFVDNVRSVGGSLYNGVEQLGNMVKLGESIVAAQLVSTYDMLKAEILKLPAFYSFPSTVSAGSTLNLPYSRSVQVVAFFDPQTGRLQMSFKYYYDTVNYYLNGYNISGGTFGDKPIPIQFVKNGEGLLIRFGISFSTTSIPVLGVRHYPSVEDYERDKVNNWQAQQDDVIVIPDVFPVNDLPDTIPVNRQAVNDWVGTGTVALPHARDWFPDVPIPNVGNPAIPDVQNPAIPADPPISGDIPDILKNILQKIVAIPLILTQILDWLKKATDVKKFELDFDPLKVDLKNKFPFCIPFDFYNTVKIFSANAKKPELRVNLDTAYFKVNHTLDLGLIAYPLGFFRLTAIWWYVMFLIGKTKDMMKW